MGERYTLYKRGSRPLTIRKRDDGYELKTHQDYYGQEYWERLPQSDEVIEQQIMEYNEPIPDNVIEPMPEWNRQLKMDLVT